MPDGHTPLVLCAQAGEKRVSKMVFIGKDLEEDLIREGFEECVVKA